MKSLVVAAGVIAATPPAALAMILFTITTLAADPVQFDASSGGARWAPSRSMI